MAEMGRGESGAAGSATPRWLGLGCLPSFGEEFEQLLPSIGVRLEPVGRLSPDAEVERMSGGYAFLIVTALGGKEDWEKPEGRADTARPNRPDFAT